MLPESSSKLTPVNLQDHTASPVRAYGGPQAKPASPHRPHTSHRLGDSGAQTSVDIVGELFNFTQPANLAPKYTAAGGAPPELPAWSHQRMYLNGRFLYNVSSAFWLSTIMEAQKQGMKRVKQGAFV